MSDSLTAPEADSESQAGESRFIWYELVTGDHDRAIAFYEKVIGWKAADQTMADIGFRYSILSAGETPVAGLMTLTDEMRAAGGQPGWLGVIGVADTDEAAKSIEQSGGSIHKAPDDIPNVGRFAVVADPAGTVFEIMTPIPPEQEPAQPAPGTPGHVGWHELYSGNGEKAAFQFYSGQFGWETMQEMDMGPMGTYRIFGADGVQMGGMMDKPDNVPVSAWSFYFNVDAIDSAVDRVKEGGGQVLMGPMEVPGGSWVIQGIDPQGAHFALVSLRR